MVAPFENILHAAWSPEGDRAALAISDGSLRLVDPVQGSTLLELSAHEGPVWALAWTPEGVITAAEDDTLRLWSDEGELVWEMPVQVGQTRTLAVDSEHTLLATGGVEGRLDLWSLVEPGLLATLPGHSADVNALAFSEDGRLASVSGAGRARVWSVPEGELLLTVDEGDLAWMAARFTPDGRGLILGADDGTVRALDSAAPPASTPTARACRGEPLLG